MTAPPFVCDGLPDRGAAISLGRDDGQGWHLPAEERIRCLAVMGLRAGNVDLQRASMSVYSGVNLTAADPLPDKRCRASLRRGA